ncbi:Fe-S-containing hydro-lyase [Alkaliphilus transvaalensis]|uniref:Fe-S-containing hydro-lyase n=1 Tax=Alkaliphilus transvaalensis TaxID=114628 RepID=UPI00047A2A8F|nr:Fe-S-containing hydro-lyase [Alkaliphilus transvaalensis]
MNTYHITVPIDENLIHKLKAGDKVFLSGYIYTARDAAHDRLLKEISEGKNLPFPLEGELIYYVGPTPAPQGKVIGSAGPTTSSRMDVPTVTLLDRGLRGMIGKGNRSKEVIEAIKENKGVYFAAIGGAGALIANTIKESELIAYEDLGTEAIRRLKVEDLPVIVAIDSDGNNLYEMGPQMYRENFCS